MLKKVFDRYEEETITEEQVRRVLEPVIKMVQEGRFGKQPRRFNKKTRSLISQRAIADRMPRL